MVGLPRPLCAFHVSLEGGGKEEKEEEEVGCARALPCLCVEAPFCKEIWCSSRNRWEVLTLDRPGEVAEEEEEEEEGGRW